MVGCYLEDKMKKIIGVLLLMMSGAVSANVDLSVIVDCEANSAVRIIDGDVVLFLTPNVLAAESVEANPDLQQYLMSVYKRADEVLNIIDVCYEEPLAI